MEKVLRFEITDRCNQNCDMCWSNEWNHKEMKFSIIEKMLYDYASVYPNGIVVLTSREPLLSPFFKDTVSLTKKLGLRCKLLTNGTLLTDDMCSFIVNSNIDFISISIHGDMNYHNNLVHKSNSYQKIIEGLEKINYYKEKFNRDDLEIRITSVMNPNLANSIQEILYLCFKYKTTFRLQHYMWHDMNASLKNKELLMKSLNYDDSISSDFPSLPSVNPNEALNITKKAYLYSGIYGVDFQGYPNLNESEINDWYSCSYGDSLGKYCDHASSSIRVRANGDVSLCQYINYKIGSVIDNSIIDLNKKYQEVTKSLDRGELYPICNRCCHVRVKKLVKSSLNGKI